MFLQKAASVIVSAIGTSSWPESIGSYARKLEEEFADLAGEPDPMDGPTTRDLRELILQLRHHLWELTILLQSVQGTQRLLPAAQLRKFLRIKGESRAVCRKLEAVIAEADRSEATAACQEGKS